MRHNNLFGILNFTVDNKIDDIKAIANRYMSYFIYYFEE